MFSVSGTESKEQKLSVLVASKSIGPLNSLAGVARYMPPAGHLQELGCLQFSPAASMELGLSCIPHQEVVM